MAILRKKPPKMERPEDPLDERSEDLSFDNDQPEPPPQAGPDPDEEVSEAGLTGAAMPGDDASTEDDLTPETLFHEDGVRWPNEPHDRRPPEEQFSEVRVDEIGAGRGLDEAELGRVKPLDKKPWDGNLAEPLGAGPSADEDFPSGDLEPDEAVEQSEDQT